MLGSSITWSLPISAVFSMCASLRFSRCSCSDGASTELADPIESGLRAAVGLLFL